MVIGIEKFKEYFKDFSDKYIIIGGTACDIIIEDEGFVPRATKDIDMILVVEALSSDFVKQFWAFIKEANYEFQHTNAEERKYYRFLKPTNKEFPKQIELFSRIPDAIKYEGEGTLTPIPVDDDLSNLSAILMNEDYYNYTLEHSTTQQDLQLANIEALICLKAKAFLDLSARKAKGEKIDEKNIRKHKTDVFRLIAMVPANDIFEIPESVAKDLNTFTETMKTELPDKNMFVEFGLPNASAEALLAQLITNFGLTT